MIGIEAIINNPDKVKLFGIEDEKLYKENLNAYRGSLGFKEDAVKYLNILSSAIANLKLKAYSPRLKELEKKADDYDSGKAGFKDYVLSLSQEARSSGIDLKSYTRLNERRAKKPNPIKHD